MYASAGQYGWLWYCPCKTAGPNRKGFWPASLTENLAAAEQHTKCLAAQSTAQHSTTEHSTAHQETLAAHRQHSMASCMAQPNSCEDKAVNTQQPGNATNAHITALHSTAVRKTWPRAYTAQQAACMDKEQAARVNR
jgi:hypothetical protein